MQLCKSVLAIPEFEIVFGAQVRLPMESRNNNENEMKWPPVKDYILLKESYRNLIHNTVKEVLQRNETHNDKYQKNYAPKTILEGDHVYIKNRSRVAFGDQKYVGPFLVIGYKGRHGFLLKCISTGKIVYRHYNDMKKTGTCHGKKSSAKRASTSIWSMRKSAQGLVKSKKPRQCRHHSDTIRRGEQPKTYPSRIRKPVQRLGFERAGEC